MTKLLSLLFTILTMWSCSPTKRIQRIVKNHPHVITMDTVTVHDTIVVESYQHDTTTILIPHKTTEVINNESVRLVYKFDTLTREIWHEVECKTDTIFRTVQIPIETIQTVTEVSPRKWWDWLLYGIAFAGIGLVLYRVFKS